MFECHLESGFLFKQIIDSFKGLVVDGNLECTAEGLSIQALDPKHVALVAMSLSHIPFDHFRCDQPISLGMNLQKISMFLKKTGRDDSMILKWEDSADILTFVFENKKSGNMARLGTFS